MIFQIQMKKKINNTYQTNYILNINNIFLTKLKIIN